jgi:glucosamine 6-phosphate synthetase-like amidotransferase/phosphosugar isomerase protein
MVCSSFLTLAIAIEENPVVSNTLASGTPRIHRSQSRAFLSEDGMPQPIEFFLASDPSAIVEHTKQVLYLEDDDIAHIKEGGIICLFNA